MPDNQKPGIRETPQSKLLWMILAAAVSIPFGAVGGSWGAAQERGRYYEKVEANSRDIASLKLSIEKITDRIDAMREDRRAAAAERTVTLEEMKRILESLLAKKE